MMPTVWVVSMVLQWLVVAVLCVLLLSVIRQLGAVNLRLNAIRDGQGDGEGPALYARLPPHELTLVDGSPKTFGGGIGSRAALVVFFSPSCGACEGLPAAIARLARDIGRDDLDLLAVISTDRAAAARFAAEKDLRHVHVAASEDFPEHYIPRHGVPFAIALTPEGTVAARGKPKNLEHLREMTHAAKHIAELATTHSARDHEWGQSAPYWDAAQAR
jgi:methylamine dehydrogenase accessory protein MauD